jgi:SWI/SNF-related matrix-associated actin-dependent regulator 1 of chromatin subfamily A
MNIQRSDKYFVISFRYSPVLVEAAKALPGKRWDGMNKVWLVPLMYESDVTNFANKYGFRFSDKTYTSDADVAFEIPELPQLTTELNLAPGVIPYPYQNQGIQRSLDLKRVLNGDKPGLGKTLQAIATVHAAKAYPCLVICPSTLKENWKREFKKFTGKDRSLILEDSNKRTFPQFYSAGLSDVFITNFESLKKYFVHSLTNQDGQKLTLRHIRFKPEIQMFKSIIIDESHRVKNGSAQSSKFCMGIASGKEYVILLSGTPVINKPKDLLSQLHIMGRLPDFGGYKGFVDRYCAGPNGASNLRELNFRLNQVCFFQREKHDVLKDLPAKVRQIVNCEISNRKEYFDAEADLIRYLREYKQASDDSIQKSMKGEVMVRINVLRQISARGKVNEVVEFVNDMLEQEEKVILFVNLHEVGNQLRKHFPKAVAVTGLDSREERQAAVDRFQTDPTCTLIICSIKAAGVGLTLTASSNVAFVEFPWTAADCDQCEDRAHRIGQKDSVTAYYFLGKNTIDEKIYKIIQTKRDMAATITGSTEQVQEDVVDLIANLF